LHLLWKARDDLQLVAEVPASRPSSPRADTRVENLMEKVRDAYELARGETADGKWGHLAEMLRLGCTRPRYRRWAVGVARGARERKEGTEGWIRPETEDQFMWWDRTSNQSLGLKEKVENWKARIHTAPPPPSDPVFSSVVDEAPRPKAHDVNNLIRKGNTKDTETNQTHSSKRSSSLGFPVVKYANSTANGSKRSKGKKAQSVHSKDVPAINQPQSSDLKGKAAVSDQPNRPRTPSTLSHPPRTSDSEVAALGPKPSGKPTTVKSSSVPRMEISDALANVGFSMTLPRCFPYLTMNSQSFLPPSFPSGLQTSTPPPGRHVPPVREKPPPIVPRSPPPPSPPPASASSSLQARIIMDTFQLDRESSLPLPFPSRKRSRPSTPSPDYKNVARSSEDLLETSVQFVKKARTMPALPSSALHVSYDPAPTTPPKPATPSKTPPKNSVPTAVLTPTRQLPTLTELLASAKKSKTHRATSRKGNQVATTSIDNGQDTEQRRSGKVSSSSTKYVRATGTPHISCSNRDVSGEDGEPEFTLNPGAFAPDFVSSQLSPELHGVHIGSLAPDRGSSAMFGTNYNSQFDLEGQMDRVSELLERDVDFDGWLKDLAEVTESRFEDNKDDVHLSP
jgi:hypothetical protein